jgi:hypothetical protein
MLRLFYLLSVHLFLSRILQVSSNCESSGEFFVRSKVLRFRLWDLHYFCKARPRVIFKSLLFSCGYQFRKENWAVTGFEYLGSFSGTLDNCHKSSPSSIWGSFPRRLCGKNDRSLQVYVCFLFYYRCEVEYFKIYRWLFHKCTDLLETKSLTWLWPNHIDNPSHPIVFI